MININDYVHWVVIKVHDRKKAEITEYLKWDNLSFAVRSKYNWYFKYRAALLQVKYPILDVEFNYGKKLPEGDVATKMLRNKIIAKKRKITEFTNKLNKAELTWSELFPIENDHLYIKAQNKLSDLKKALKEMEE